MEDQLLTVAEVSHILKVHADTVRRYIRQRDLPAAKVGRAYLVNRRDVDEFIQERLTVRKNPGAPKEQ